ncbi:HEAT repeat domain-containing protein [Holosporaceae bacterium 'Namur']|nr:HEAT repeat domain-containing protein [Holosporaceae bacterium 'Namur']
MRNPSNIERLLKDNYKNYEYLARFAESSQQYSITESFINLAILKKQVAEDKEKKLKENGGRGEKDNALGNVVRDERLETYESIHEEKEAIEVEKLFEKREGKDIKKLAIYGRAGIGKTTLCQYIAVKWAKGELWKDKFKAVIWLPLRRIVSDLLEQEQEINLAAVIRQNCMGGRESLKPSEREIDDYLGNFTDVLFILDGYDEIAQVIEELHNPAGRKISKLLEEILTEPSSNIVITSRPTSKIRHVGRFQISIDEELENIGFTSENIMSYVTKFVSAEKSKEIIKFLAFNKNIYGIAHIPINLELICYAWEELAREKNYTMSSLYKEICGKLLRRYLAKENNNGLITQEAEEIDEWEECKGIVLKLEELAIRGVRNNEIVISKTAVKEVLGREVKKVLKTGIIKNIGEDVHFIHLTFQEYFAARYIAKSIEEVGSDRYKEAVELIREHKYTPYYEVMWWYVAGVLYDRCKTNHDFIPLIRFWHLAEAEPRELVGICHIKLQIRCLDECGNDQTVSIHKGILENIKKWVYDIEVYMVISTLMVSNNICKEIIPVLINTLNNNEFFFSNRAAEILGYVGIRHGDIIVPALIKALNNNSNVVKHSVVEALGKVGIGHENIVVPVLINALNNNSNVVRHSVLNALNQVGEGHESIVIPALLVALKDSDYEGRYYAAQVLVNIGRGKADIVIPALINALKDNDKNVRSSVAKVLGKVGIGHENIVVPPLIVALKDSDKNVRSSVAKVLGKVGIGHENIVVPPLIVALKDSDKNVRSSVVEALGKVGIGHENIVVPALLVALKDSDYKVRRGATKALGKVGIGHTNKIIPALINALEDSDFEVRSRAAEALSKLETPVLINALKGSDYEVRSRAAEALGKVEIEKADIVIPALINALEDNDDWVIMNAAEALGKLGIGQADIVVPALIKALKNRNALVDGEWEVRSYIINVLHYMGVGHTEIIVPILINALKDSDYKVRDYAAEALGKVGIGYGNTVVPALINVLKDTNKNVKSSAAEALGKIGAGYADTVVPALLVALNDNNYWVRSKAAEGLGKVGIGHENIVVSPLIVALNDNNYWVRSKAAGALGKVGVGHESRVVPALLVALKDSDYKVRSKAAGALCKVGVGHESRVVPVLINILKNEDIDLIKYAAKILGKVGIGHADIVIPELIETLRNDAWCVRRDVVEALGQVGTGYGDIVIPVLINALRDNYAEVKSSAIEALGQVGTGYGDIVIPALINALKDSNDEVRNRAAEALSKIGVGHEDILVPELINALDNEGCWGIKNIQEMLHKIGERHKDIVVLELINALKNSNDKVRSRAAEALGQVGIRKADVVIPALINTLKDNYKEVRNRAAEALSKVGVGYEDIVVPEIINALKNSNDKVRSNIKEILRKIVIGQEERLGHIIADKITSNRDINEISREGSLKILNLYCFKHSSNQLWIGQFLDHFSLTNSHIRFNRNNLIVKDSGRTYDIEFTEFQKKTFLEAFKESAKNRGLSTEVYDYYLGQGTLGFRNEVGIIEKTELHKAAERGDINAVKAILAQGKIDINDQSNQYRETPLMLAAQNGHWDIVGFLVKNNAEINCFNQTVGGERKSVIGILTNVYEKHEYWLQSYNRINQLLMTARAVPFNDNVQAMSEDRKQMFLKALDEDSLNQLDAMLRNDNTDVNYYLDEDHTTLLMYTVKTRASNNIINKLIQSGASLTQLNKSKQNVFAICKKEIAKLTGTMSKDNIKGCLELLIRERKPISEARLNQAIEKLLSARLSGNNSDDVLDKVVSELTGCSSVIQYLNDNELRDIYRLHLGNILAINREHRGETKVEGNEATILLSMRIYLYIKLLLEMEQGKETKYIKPAQLKREILTTLETLNNERVRDFIDGIEISNELRQAQGLNIVEQIKNLKVGEEYSCQSGYQIGEIQSGHCLYVSFAKVEEDKIAIRIDNRWVKESRLDGRFHGVAPWTIMGDDNIPKIKSYLVGVAYLNDGREVEELKEYIEKVIQAISKTMSNANTAISYIYKTKFIQISNPREIETLTGHWIYHDRQSDGNANCTMSSHNLGVSVRNGRDAFIELCNYEKSEIWIDVETQYLEQKSPVISNTRFRGESTSLSWSERIRPTEEDKESKEGEVSVVSNTSSFSHTALMKKFQSVLGCSWDDVYSGIAVEQTLVGMSGITTPQTGACYRSKDVEGTMITTFSLRFANRQELTEFTNYYNRKFPGLLIDKSLEFQADSLIEINMDTRVLHNEVARSLGEFVVRSRTQDIPPRVDNSKMEESRCYLS